MKNDKKWTEYEISVLISRYPYMSVGKLAVELDRSESSIIAKASRLGVKKVKLKPTDEEIKKVIELSNLGYTYNQIRLETGISHTTIKTIRKNNKSKLSNNVRFKKVFTKKQIEYLKQNYATMFNYELSKKLNKSISIIYVKANELGLKKSPDYYKLKKLMSGIDKYISKKYG